MVRCNRFPLAAALLACAMPAVAQSLPPPFWGDARRGWHFYEEPAQEAPALPEPAAAPKSQSPERARPSAARVPELEEFERLQKAVEEVRRIAIMRPSEANVRRYMELEAKVVAQASTFADVAQRIAWSTPALDPTLQGRPVNAKALEVFEQQQMGDRSRAISVLGRDHVLLFFFRGDCPYCHAMAPTLAAFQARHGIRVEAVSVDGGGLPDFPEARTDNGVSTALRVTQVPAVFLAQPFTGQIAPVGFGVLSEAQLLERISAVSAPGYAALLPSSTQHLGRP